MTDPLTPHDAAQLMARLIEQWLTPRQEPDPILASPATVARALDIPVRAATNRMKTGAFGPLVRVGSEWRVYWAELQKYIAKQERKEETSDVSGTTSRPAPVDQRGERAGEHLRRDGRVAAARERRGAGAPYVVAVAPRSAGTATYR